MPGVSGVTIRVPNVGSTTPRGRLTEETVRTERTATTLKDTTPPTFAGAATIDQLKYDSQFIQITAAGFRESHVHDVAITKEAPNYRSE